MSPTAIRLNGQEHELGTEPVDIPAFLQSLGLDQLPVLVELNGEAILTREFALHRIRPGDVVEIVRMVAGG